MIDFSEITDITIDGKRINYIAARDVAGSNIIDMKWIRPLEFRYTTIRYETANSFGYTPFRDTHGRQVLRLPLPAWASFCIYPDNFSDIAVLGNNNWFGAVTKLSAYCVKNDTEYQDLISGSAPVRRYLAPFDAEWILAEWQNSDLENKIWIWASPQATETQPVSFSQIGHVHYEWHNGAVAALTSHVPACFSTNTVSTAYSYDETLRIVDATAPLVTFDTMTGATITPTGMRNDFSDYISMYDSLTGGQYSREDYPYLMGAQKLMIKIPAFNVDYGAELLIGFIAYR